MRRSVNTQPPQKVLGYIRVSSTEQVKDGESLERQEEQIRAYCKFKGIEGLEILADKGLSGFKSSRPGFQELIRLCKSREVRMVIVYDLSRLSRSVRDTLAFIEDVIQKYGIEFVSIQNDIDTTTPMGKAFLGFNAIFNQLYRDEISFKTKAALKHKRGKGEKTGGHTPYGFEIVGGAKLEADPKETAVIRRIQELRAAGLSLRRIAAELQALGIPTKTGKGIWRPQVIKEMLSRQVDAPLPSPASEAAEAS